MCPENGIYEFAKIAAPSSAARSWLLENSPAKLVAGEAEESTDNGSSFNAHIVKDADLYVASPIDPLFLVLPALSVARSSKSSDAPKRMFLSSDDHFDVIAESSNHLSEILRWPLVRGLLESRMSAICDTVDAGDESMFRLNEGKLLAEILSKALKMSEGGLPKSMEEKFVTKPLEAPFLASRSQPALGPTTSHDASPLTTDGVTTPQTEATESQESTSSVESSDSLASAASVASTAATSVTNEPAPAVTEEIAVAMTASEEVIKLQRLRVAFNFICSSYIPPSMADPLKEGLATSGGPVDFAPLEDYLSRLTQVRQEAMAARSLTDYSRKRTLDEEDDERAEKRRKKEDDEKRKKAGESRGVRDLKKVNVNGMKKLSDFFKKK